MDKDELAEVLARQKAAESKHQTKRALIGAFVVIPGILVLFVIGWVVGRLLDLW